MYKQTITTVYTSNINITDEYPILIKGETKNHF